MICISAALLLALAFGAEPATTSASIPPPADGLAADRLIEWASLVQMGLERKFVGPMDLSKTVELKLVDGRFAAHAELPREAGPGRSFTVPTSTQADRAPRIIFFEAQNVGGRDELSQSWTMQIYDLYRPEASLALTTLIVTPAQMVISDDAERDDSVVGVQLIQTRFSVDELGNAGPGVVMYVNGPGDYNRRWGAPSVAHLLRTNPVEVREALMPLVQRLGQPRSVLAIDADQAAQVVSSADLSEDQKILLAGIVDRLNADSIDGRRAAAAELRDLGSPAANALQDADRRSWSAEQHSAIETFLSEQTQLDALQAQALRDDPNYLLDVMEQHAGEIGSNAAARLSALLHLAIKWDADATPAQRAAGAQALRMVLRGRLPR